MKVAFWEKKINWIKKNIVNQFYDDRLWFKVLIGFKMSGIFLISLAFTSFSFGIVIRLNNLFVEANGFENAQAFKDAYFDFITKEVWNLAPYLGGISIALFLLGFYLGALLLRPFRNLANHCEQAQNGGKQAYRGELFSDLKLLSNFSEIFFLHIENCLAKQKYEKILIPPYYSKIHKPVFEKVFFFHFFVFVALTCFITGMVIFLLTNGLHDSMVQFVHQQTKNTESMSYFLVEQKSLISDLNTTSIVIMGILFFGLSFNLYSSVSSPAFAVFSTMRAFLKGDTKVKIHLIGYKYLREYCRTINKFLDLVRGDLIESSAQENNLKLILKKGK